MQSPSAHVILPAQAALEEHKDRQARERSPKGERRIPDARRTKTSSGSERRIFRGFFTERDLIPLYPHPGGETFDGTDETGAITARQRGRALTHPLHAWDWPVADQWRGFLRRRRRRVGGLGLSRTVPLQFSAPQ